MVSSKSRAKVVLGISGILSLAIVVASCKFTISELHHWRV